MKGLKKLEHRGYDSYGIFCYGQQSTRNVKQTGSITDEQYIDLLTYSKQYHYSVCMGHTRWATNGEVSEANTHPIASRDCKVHVVHNGIIENAKELKTDYGIECIGDTDTEVIANVISAHLKSEDYSGDFFIELERIAGYIKGDNAFVVHYQCDDWKYSLFTFVTGNGILYVRDGYISSEINALAGYVHNAVKLIRDNIYLVNRFGSIINDYDIDLIYIDVPDECKNMNVDNPMLSEIKEQADYGSVKFPFSISVHSFKMDKILLTGCGSSYYAGMFGQRCFEQIAGIETQIKYATEFMHCSRQYNDRNYHYICISQSGETKDTLDAIAPLPYENTITITNNPYCSMKRYARHNIYMNTGQEVGVAATKTFFESCFILAQMAIQQTNNTSVEHGSGVGDDLYKFKEYIEDTIDKADKWAKEFVNQVEHDRYLFLGSSLTYPIALEAALKMKEVAYLSAEGMPASEIKHGPIALVDSYTLSVFILSQANRSNMQSIISNIEEIKSRDGKVLVVCDWYTQQNYSFHYDYIFTLPEMISSYGCEHIISSLACIIPLQLFAYYTAVREGYDPNRPRNLAKTCTV